VTYHGQVKVVDFGIAKAVDTETGTAAGVFKGKFSYAAPEQVKGHVVDRRADVFAAGVMLWEMLANRRFAPGGLTEAAAEARVSGTEPRVASVAPEVDPELAAICDRAIAVDPADRYPSAEAFRADLLSHLLAQGELVQQVQLGDLIRSKFAAERLAMHRLIHAQAKRHTAFEYIGYLGDSIVRSLPRSETTRRSRPLPVINGADADYPGHTSQTDQSGQTGQSVHSSQSVHRSQGGWGQHDRSPVRPLAPWMTATSGDKDNLMHGSTASQALFTRRRRRTRAVWLLLPATAAFCGAYIWMRAQLESPKPLGFSAQPASSPASHQAEGTPAADADGRKLEPGSAQAAANRAPGNAGEAVAADAEGTAHSAQSDDSARTLLHRPRRAARLVSTTTAAQRAATGNGLTRGADGDWRSGAGRPLARGGAEDDGKGAGSSEGLSVQAGEVLHVRSRPQGPRQIELEDPFRVSKRRPESSRPIEREDPFR